MALTTYLMSQASDHLTSKSIELWIILFRQLPEYKQYAFLYAPEVENKLVETEGTLKARALNALMQLVDELGPGEFKIVGDRDGLQYSHAGERLALIREAFSLLFDDISTMIVPSIFNEGPYTVAVGQRNLSALCGVCGSNYYWSNNLRLCGCTG